MSNNEERARILRMVAEGTVSPAEGEDLLAALETPRGGEGRPGGAASDMGPRFPSGPLRSPPPRSLIIRVSEGGDSKVDVRIPLSLARAAGKFVPRRAQEYLDNYDIKIDQLLETLTSTEVAGPLIEIRDDEDHVVIAVE